MLRTPADWLNSMMMSVCATNASQEWTEAARKQLSLTLADVQKAIKEIADANRNQEKSVPGGAVRTASAIEAARADFAARRAAYGEAGGTSTDPCREVAPDYVEPIKGYRSWKVTVALDGDEQLPISTRLSRLSAVQSIGCWDFGLSRWLAKEQKVAQCGCRYGTKVAFLSGIESTIIFDEFGIPTRVLRHPKAPLGEDGHSCGVYAWKSEQLAVNHLIDAWAEGRIVTFSKYGLEFYMLGEVWLWGQVVEHELGYRAEIAYPAAFWETERSWFEMERVVSLAKMDLARLWEVPLVKAPAVFWFEREGRECEYDRRFNHNLETSFYGGRRTI
jgi:hypothetical protein